MLSPSLILIFLLPLGIPSKVQLMEDPDTSSFQLKNLSRAPVASAKDALNMLFIGDTNKMMAETPSNPMSSRSHCIFTVYVQARSRVDAKVRNSKLHLVDLAG